MAFDEGLPEALREPLEYFISPERRLFVPFLASSFVLAFWAYRARGERSGFFRYLVPEGALSHQSTRLDCALLCANSAIRVLLFAPLLVEAVSVMAATAAVLEYTLGKSEIGVSSPVLVGALYAVAFFVADDASRFWLHRAFHNRPSLWKLHQVHHSAEVLTPLTLYRIHPLESLIYAVRSALVSGGVTGVFFYVFNRGLTTFDVLGVNAFAFAFNVVGSNLRHSHVPFSFGRFERWFVSPAMHQIHHSLEADDNVQNLGTALSVWDRWLGSWKPAVVAEPLTFGLRSDERNHTHGVFSALVQPVLSLFRRRRPGLP